MQNYDVIAIGGGIAGAAAALSAARAGANVLLVRRGPGATALAHGGWHTAPPQAVAEALAAADLELTECSGALAHPAGVTVRCAVAATSHARASVASAAAGHSRTIVCGIAGLPSFRPTALCALWGGAPFVPVSLTMPGTPGAGWSPVSLAACIERDPAVLAVEVERAAHEHGAARAILPAVLGLNDHARVLAAVVSTAGIVIGEALGVAPSVPGWRLDRALLRALGANGVSVLHGAVRGGVLRQGRLEQIHLSTDGIVCEIDAHAFVLATGKFLGGGITADAEFEESALGCDVAIERFARTIDDPGAALMLTDPVRTEPQPVLSTGVRVDGEGRPLDAAGAVHARNVFVAGTVRAGVETARLGLGAAAHEGWDAGTRAAAAAAASIA